MSYQEHQRESAKISAQCAVVTLSDTRTEESDASGAAIRRLLIDAGHHVTEYQIIKDEPAALEKLLAGLLAREDVQVILTNGGTGVSRRDQTIDVIERRLEIRLPGFGELFRMLSWQEVGGGAMLSRATGGICRGKPIFAMPGSTRAVELAMSKLIVPELGHLIRQLQK